MQRILLPILVLVMSICGGIYVANSQTNPGFNPNLQWCGTQGSVAIRGAANWQCLLPGTNGQVLQSGGPAANPSWLTVTGTGTVTSVSGSGGTTGMTLTGGPITGAGTLTLGGTLAIANGGTGGVGGANTVLRSNGTVNAFAKIAAGDFAAGAIANTDISASAAIAPSKFATQPALTVLANITGGAAVPTTPTVTALLDAAFTSTQGSVLYRNVGGWGFLTPGTNGQFLATGGAGANPAWQTVTGGNLGSIPNGTVLANISGSTGAPANPTVSQLLDATLSSTQGTILYRDSAVWNALTPGTAGTFLQTGGAAANPVWSTRGQILGTNTNNNATAGNIGEEIISTIQQGSAVVIGGTPTNVTSISLTAGDWDLSAHCGFKLGSSATVNFWGCEMTSVSGTQGTDVNFMFYDAISYTAGTGVNVRSIAPARVSLSGSATYYLISVASTSGGSPVGWGGIRARRIR